MHTEAEIYQLLIDYKVRTAEAEQAMARMQTVTQQTTNAMTGLAPAAGQAQSRLAQLSQVALGVVNVVGNLANAFLGVVSAVQQFVIPAAKMIKDLADQGAALSATRDEYRKLADAVGDAGDTMLAQMRAVTKGTVDDQTLMQTALRLTELAGKEAFTALPSLMAIASQQARKMGISTAKAMDDIITGVGRGSAEMLDNLGIVVDTSTAYKKLAESLGVATSELTKEQKQMVLLAEIQRKYGVDVEAVASGQLSASKQIQAYSTQLKNLRDELVMELLPATQDLMGVAMPLISGLFQDAVPIIENLITKVTELTAAWAGNREAIAKNREDFEKWLRTRVADAGGVMSPELEAEARERARETKIDRGEGRQGAITTWLETNQYQQVVDQVKAETDAVSQGYRDLMDIYQTLVERKERLQASLSSGLFDASIMQMDREALAQTEQALAAIESRLVSMTEISQREREAAATAWVETTDLAQVRAQEDAKLLEAIRISAEERVRIEEEAARLIAEAQADGGPVNARAAQLEAERAILEQSRQQFSEYYTGITEGEQVALAEQVALEEENAQERKLIAEGLYQDLMDIASNYQQAAEASTTEFLADLAELQHAHEEDLLVLQQDRAMARAALLADYQQQIAAAQRAGDAEEVAQLQSKLNIELVEMNNANAKEDALQDRARKVEEIKRIRAYQVELQQLRAKINDEFVMRLLDAANKSGLDTKVVEAKLKALNVELSAQAQVAIEVAKINQQKGKSEWQLAQEVYGASKSRIDTLIAEAKKRLDIAQGELAAWSPPPVEIPAQVDLDITYGGIGGDTKREETVVEALDATVGRIVDIVGNAIDTLEKLVGYEERTEEIKAAAQRLGEDIRELIAALFPYAESFGKDAAGNRVSDWRDIPKAVAEFAGWASSTIGAYASAISTLSNLADLEIADVGGKIAWVADVIGVVIRELDRVRQTFADAAGQWRDQPKDAAHFAQYATEALGVVKAAAEAIWSLVDLPELEDVGGLLERVKTIVQHWMWRLADLAIGFDDFFKDQGSKFGDKVAAFAELVETAFSALAKVAETIPKLVDLPAFDSVGEALGEAHRFIAHWLRRMTELYLAFTEQYKVDDKSLLVAKLQAFAEMVEKLFTMLSKVVTTIQQLKDVPEFDETTVDVFDRLKRFVAHWLRRMADLSAAFETEYGKDALAKLYAFTETVQALAVTLADVIVAIQGLQHVPGFDESTVTTFDNLKRFVAHWLRRMQDLSLAFEAKYGKEALAKLKTFADTLKPLFALLSDVIETVRELENVPEFDEGTVSIFDRLKRFVAHWLRRMQDLSLAFEAKYGKDALAKLKTFADTVRALVGILADLVAAIQDLDDVPGFDESTVGAFDRLKRYVAHWLRRMADLSAAFEKSYGKDALGKLQTFADTLSTMFALLRDVLETIGSLRRVRNFDESTVKVFDTLKRYVAHWLRRIADLKEAFETRYGLDMTEELQAFAEMLQSSFGALKDVLDLIKQLGTVNLKVPTLTFDNLQDVIEQILARLELVASQYEGTEGQAVLARITKLAEVLGPIGTALGAIVQPFADMSRMRWIPEQALAALKMNVENVIVWFLDLAAWLSGATLDKNYEWTGGDADTLADRLEALQGIGETVTAIIGPFKQAYESLFDLGKLAGGKAASEADIGKVGTFIQQVFQMLTGLTTGLAVEWDKNGTPTDPMTTIERIKAVIGGIIEVFDAGIDAMDRLFQAKVPSTETIQSFVSAIIALYTEFARVLGLMEYDATNFLRDVSWYAIGQGLVQSLIDGIYSMSSGLTAANAWLWSFIQAMPGAGGLPTATMAQASAGNTYHYSINQYGVKEAGHGARDALVGFRIYNNLRGR